MEESSLDVKNRFTHMLEDYLAGQTETARAEAFRIGRSAASEGVGELQIVELFYSVVQQYLGRSDGTLQPERLRGAVDFLSDCLAPYDARNKAYRQINDTLNRENRRLKSELELQKWAESSLIRSKEYYKTLIENSLDIVTVLNRDGAIRYISSSLRHVMGYEPDDLIGRKIIDFIHPESRSSFRLHFSRLQRSRNRIRLSEFRFRSSDGSWRYLESNANFIDDTSPQGYIIVNSRDVTERVLAREKLQKRERQLSIAQQIARLGSWEWDFRSDTLKWTRELSKIYDIEHDEAPASIRNNPRVIHPEDRLKAEHAFRKALTGDGEIDFEQRIVRPDGEERILHVRGEVIKDRDQRPVKLVGTGQDITELKRVEKRLQSYSELLRKLAARQSRIREAERIRISREIHDELGQMLTVLKMELFLFKERAAEEGENPFAKQCVNEVGQMISRFDSIIKSVQRITTDLRPEVLDTLGLVEAIEWQCRMFETKTGIRILFSSTLESSHIIDDERSTAVFRILQETLTNIEEHADATRAEVQLRREGQNVVLVVQDNGRGIPAEKIDSPESLGIIGMVERSLFLGGEISIEGEGEEGTTVTLKIPL